MATVHFQSSDSFMDSDSRAAESADVEVIEYLEATYWSLRHYDGVEIAEFVDGAWELPDGRRFSDWAVAV